MLGSGKNHNLNVSAIKEKTAFVSMFSSMGDGLGSSDYAPQVEDLFTEKKKKSEIKEPNFEDSNRKIVKQEP